MDHRPKSKIRNYKASRKKKIRANHCDLGLGKKCLHIMSKAQSIKEKLIRWISSKLRTSGASLVAQWLRVCLPMQETRVRLLVWEDPTCRGAAGPVSHNYWACASGACALQQERLRWWEAHAPQWRVAPACRNYRKPSHRNGDPTQP